MSQPCCENPVTRMLTYDDLVNDMAAGCKPRSQWKIGIEHEQFLYNKATGAPLPYDGRPGIKQVLEGFRDDYGWSPVIKNNYLVELRRDGASVTLEPGGQFELSGAPLGTLAAVRAQADAFYTELETISHRLGFGILPRGFHPKWRRQDMHWMPKERYDIMRPYMEAHSKHGVDMMIRTCGAQVNLDFSSEADMVKKYRVALGFQPVITALMANSSVVEGRDSRYRSYRSFIWTETDHDRTGVPAFIFDADMGFARYVDYALEVPMYFIMRNGRHVNVAGQSFRDFMEGRLKGHEGAYPSIDDWRDHLTTLFPEVRLKSYLEFRGPDSAPQEEVYAMAAFWVGLFHHQDSLDQAWDLIRDWTAENHKLIRNDVPVYGIHTMIPEGHTLRNLGIEAMELAALGLKHAEPPAGLSLRVFQEKLKTLD